MTETEQAKQKPGKPSRGRMLTTAEAADFVGVPVRTFEKWRKITNADGSPRGPDFYDYGAGNIRYDIRDLEAWLKTKKRTPGEDGFAA